MSDFHFLRPWWLLALPVGLWLAWMLLRGGTSGGAWRKVVEASLQPHVLAGPGAAAGTRLPLIAGLAAVTLATLALAGPSWERAPVPAVRDEGALVVVLDLSRSMDAADVQPSRLARARLKLMSLLERRQGGQTALVVFTTHAYTVTPLTTDTRTIAAMVNALSTDIMPSQGSAPESGLERAAQLLRQTGLMRGDVLLITDAEVSPRVVASARELRREGFALHVLGVGTEQGSPIALPGGGFLTDASGRVVIPRVDPSALRRLAGGGGGRFALLTSDDADLDTLFPDVPAAAVAASRDNDEPEVEVWLDRGLWLLLALVPLTALVFRRGWVVVLAAALVVPVSRAEASLWASIWQRADQRGYEAMLSDEPGRAAELFNDREWRAAAQYRAGEYASSAATLEDAESVRAHYNRGNALARAGQLLAAIASYERALELDPAHEDARYNRDLLEELLEQNPDLGAPQDGDGEDEGESEQSPQEGEQPPPEAEQEGDSGADPTGAGPDPEEGDPERAGEESGDPMEDEAEPFEDPADPSAGEHPADFEERQDPPEEPEPSIDPMDVEEWASEQAAEQWLRRIPQDPGGLLRRKFLYQYQRLGLDQDGNRVQDEVDPW